MQSELSAKGWKSRLSASGGSLPDMFIACSPQMVSAYERFGDCISFDLTYNLLKQRTPDGEQWGTGLFVGFDTNLRIVLLGMCILTRETAENFMLLFKNYFELLGKEPQTIITD